MQEWLALGLLARRVLELAPKGANGGQPIASPRWFDKAMRRHARGEAVVQAPPPDADAPPAGAPGTLPGRGADEDPDPRVRANPRWARRPLDVRSFLRTGLDLVAAFDAGGPREALRRGLSVMRQHKTEAYDLLTEGRPDVRELFGDPPLVPPPDGHG